MDLLKKREAKNSKRGIYIQDKELIDSNFTSGKYFSYEIDMKERKIRIIPSDKKTNNKVSKRRLKNIEKPVLDIRSKEALAIFKGCSKLKVEIYKNEILVIGEISDNGNKASYTAKIDKRELLLVAESEVGQLSLFSKDYFSQSKEGQKNIYEAIENLEIPLALISLFSGAGMMDYGFKDVGFDIELAVEYDENAAKTYKENFGDHVDIADIRSYDKTKFEKIGSPVMIGGSPCQGFSSANRASNFLDNPNNLLVKHYIDSIKANPNCKVFVLENVPQLLTAGDGAFREEIESALSEFEITSGVLNAADYGDAQLRRRTFMIGSKIGKIDLPSPTHDKKSYKTVKEAFAGITNFTPNQKDFSKPKESTVERMKEVPQGGNWRDIPEHIKTKKMQKGSTHSSVYRRLSEDSPSITIANPRKSNITHPILNRSLSIRECARLFGLPDSFIFKGTLSSMQQQVCNGVPVGLARAVANRIKKAIIQYNALIAKNRVQVI